MLNGGEAGAPARVLVVEDDEATRELLLALLAERGYRARGVGAGEAALKALEAETFDVVLLDVNLPGMSGLNVLTAAQVLDTRAQFVLMTAYASVDAAVEAMKSGAFDYLEKPLRTDELLLTVERALRESETQRELARLRRETSAGIRQRILGRSPVMQRLFDLVERVAPTRATVLITGETGTGKELVARAVHDLSPRAAKPFVPTNCSSLPETLLESELFGHLKGSFTGAIANKRGLFEEAHGGTLFLDEISTISSGIQVKLLRVVQERAIQRVGGGALIPVDFRLVAATNVDLAQEVESGRFREDLFYRLNVFPIHVPPLRERRSDIPLLANHFRLRYARENGLEPPDLPPETLRRLTEYAWPGNVRELENFMERAVITYAGTGVLRFDDPVGLPQRRGRGLLERGREEQWPLSRLEREHILQVLEASRGHRGRAASVLGIDRRTLYRKLKEYEADAAVPG